MPVAPQVVVGDSVYTFKSFKGTQACHANRYFQDYRCSPAKIIALAQEGDADAQYALGYLFYYGIGLSRDVRRGKQWIRKAAAQGNKEAVMALAMINDKQHVRKKQRQHHPRAAKKHTQSPVERSQQAVDRQFRAFWISRKR